MKKTIFQHAHGCGPVNMPVQRNEIEFCSKEAGPNHPWYFATSPYPNRQSRRSMAAPTAHKTNNRPVTLGRIAHRILHGGFILSKKVVTYLRNKKLARAAELKLSTLKFLKFLSGGTLSLR